MAYIKPSVLVYQELENAGGVANVTPDLGVVVFGPLYNVVRVDTASDSSLTETLGASSTDIAKDLEETVVDGPTGLKIDLKNTKPGQLVDQDSINIIGTNVYVKTFEFQNNVGNAATQRFDGTTFRSKFTLWDTATETYFQTFTPAGVTPDAILPDGSGTHLRVKDKVTVTYTSPDWAGDINVFKTGTLGSKNVVTVTTYTEVQDNAAAVITNGPDILTITVPSGHGIVAGDTVYLRDQSVITEFPFGEYTVDSVGATTVVILATGAVAATGTIDIFKKIAHNVKVGNRVSLNPSTYNTLDGDYEVIASSPYTFTVENVSSPLTTIPTFVTGTGAFIATLTTTITAVENIVSPSGTPAVLSFTMADKVPAFATGGTVTATIKVFRFYNSLVIPQTFKDGVNTLDNVDLSSANDDYVWLLADRDPPFDAVGPVAYETVVYGDATDYRIMSGNFHVAYKALRQDKYSTIITITSAAELETELGEATEENPLALGVKIASDNTTTSVMAVSLKKEDDGNLGWARALELVENQRNAYALVPLTQEEAVLAAFKAHAEQMSTPVNASWRVALVNTAIPTTKNILQANADSPVTTGTSEIVGSFLYLQDSAHQNGNADSVGEFVGSGVTPGDVVVITDVTGQVVNSVTANVASADEGEFYVNTGTAGITVGTNNIAVAVGAYARGTTGGAAEASIDPESLKRSWIVDEVPNSSYLKLLDFASLTTLDGLGITYYIYRDLTRVEQAAAVAAASTTFRSNRCWHIQPDIVGVNVGGQVKYLPGYYLAAGHGGMTAGFPVQQGFTNIAVAGIEDLRNSNFYFKKEELNLMAEAGTCLYVQETQGGLPYCRHSLTTDMTVLEYREQVKVKNWDFLSFYYYDKMKGFIGTWNITPDTLSNMKQTMIAASELLITQKLPRIGAPLLSYEEPSVVQNEFNKDMVDIRMKIETVTPNNYTNIYLVI